jgi:hypothetical protein
MTDEDKTAAFAAHRPAGLEPRSAFILVLADPEDPHHVSFGQTTISHGRSQSSRVRANQIGWQSK